LKINERMKLFFAVTIPIILTCSIFWIRNFLGVGIFNGTRNEALNILSGIVQGLSTIVAIIFALIIVVVQTTLTKYVTKTVQYVFLNWLNFLVLTLYLNTIMIAFSTMWIIDQGIVPRWVDVTMAMTAICISSLIPFFIFLPSFLKLSNVMNQMKNEVLDAFREKDEEKFGLITSKISLLVNTIKKALEVGEDEYAFEGVKFLEEIIEKEDFPKQRWSFHNYILSTLDDLSTISLKRNPNFTLTILQTYKKMLQKLQEIPPAFHNVANRMVQSTMNICKEGLDTKLGESFASMSYHLIVYVYKVDVLLGYAVFCVIDFDPNLRQVLRFCKTKGIIERVSFDFETNDSILELLKKQKESEALHLLQIMFKETPKTQFMLQGVISLIEDAKVEGFDSFASSTLNKTKKNFKQFSIETIYDPKLEGRSELSVSSDYKVVFKTGNEKQNEAFLWIKRQIG